MPDMNQSEQEPREKRHFIREKVARPHMTRKQLAGRMAALSFIAVLGGAAAGAGFAVARPLAEKYLVEHPTQESIPVTIPKDDPDSQIIESSPEESDQAVSDSAPEAETETTEEPETESETTTEETESETETLEEVIYSVIEGYEYSLDDLAELYGTFRDVVQKADKGIVEVHSVKKEVDWFDNPVETAGLYAGVAIAVTDQELLILTPEAAVEHADSIKVTFANGTEADGTIKKTDAISNMAIVSVSTSQMNEKALTEVEVLKLGNSYSIRQGDLVAALGAPAGVVHSSAYGTISYVARNVQVADGVTRLLYADIKSNAEAGTFLVNLAGEVVGWVTDGYGEGNPGGFTVAMAVSDYKSILEKMSNGQPIPYMGIRGQEVSTAMTSEGIPLGIYVTESIQDGPAYNAGIQNGDIIVNIGGKDIATIRDYQNETESLNPDSVVTVVVQRKAIEEYKELEYQVTIGAR